MQFKNSWKSLRDYLQVKTVKSKIDGTFLLKCMLLRTKEQCIKQQLKDSVLLQIQHIKPDNTVCLL